MGLSLSELRDGLPEGGLFGGGAWRWSPEPLKLNQAESRKMMSLGHPLARFQQACDSLYRRSAAGKLPGGLVKRVCRSAKAQGYPRRRPLPPMRQGRAPRRITLARCQPSSFSIFSLVLRSVTLSTTGR